MAKTKEKLFGDKEGSAWKYFNSEDFCQDFSENTVWCEEDFFEKNVLPSFGFGEVYIITPSFKLLLIVKTQNSIKVFTSDGVEIDGDEAMNYVADSDIAVEFRTLINEQQDFFYVKLYGFLKGRVSAEELTDYSFVDDVLVKNPRGESIIELSLSWEILEVLNLDATVEYFYRCSRLGNCREFSYETERDFFLEEGVPLYHYFHFSHSAYDKFSKLRNFFRNNNVRDESFNNFLNYLFPNQISMILDTFTDYKNQRISEIAFTKFEEDKNRLFGDKVSLNVSEEKLSIKANYLFYLMTIYNDNYLNFESTFKQIVNALKWYEFGEWTEDVYEWEDDSFTQWLEYINEVNPYVDEIYEHFDTEEKLSNMIQLTKILNKFDMKTPYPNPVDPNTMFNIQKYDSDSGKLEVEISKVSEEDDRSESMGTRKMTVDEFNEFITNQKLKFESRNILLSLRKILSNDSQ